jgi:hypothetical protein
MSHEHVSHENTQTFLIDQVTREVIEYLLDSDDLGLSQSQENDLAGVIRKIVIEKTQIQFPRLYKSHREVDIIIFLDEMVSAIQHFLEKNPLRGLLFKDIRKTQSVIGALAGKTKIADGSLIVEKLLNILEKKTNSTTDDSTVTPKYEKTLVLATPEPSPHKESGNESDNEISGDDFFEKLASIEGAENLRIYLDSIKNKTLLVSTTESTTRISIQRIITLFNDLSLIFENGEFDTLSGKFKVWHILSPWVGVSKEKQPQADFISHQLYPSLVRVLQK